MRWKFGKRAAFSKAVLPPSFPPLYTAANSARVQSAREKISTFRHSSRSALARSILLRHTGSRPVWRSIPNPPAAKALPDVGSRRALGCRPTPADAPVGPHGVLSEVRDEGEPESASQHDAGPTRRPARPTRQVRAVHEASQLFRDNLLQNVAVQTQVRDQAHQLAVLIAELARFTQFAQTKNCLLLLQPIKALLANAMLAADLYHRCARLCFPKYPQDLLFAMTLPRHLPALLYVCLGRKVGLVRCLPNQPFGGDSVVPVLPGRPKSLPLPTRADSRAPLGAADSPSSRTAGFSFPCLRAASGPADGEHRPRSSFRPQPLVASTPRVIGPRIQCLTAA